jgi:inner membrane protein
MDIRQPPARHPRPDLEDNALLVGAVASFLAVAAVMYFTRKIDWYSSLPPATLQAEEANSVVPKDMA